MYIVEQSDKRSMLKAILFQIRYGFLLTEVEQVYHEFFLYSQRRLILSTLRTALERITFQ